MPKTTAMKGARRRSLRGTTEVPQPSSDTRPAKRQRQQAGETSVLEPRESTAISSAANRDASPGTSESVDTFMVSQEFPPVALKLVRAIQNPNHIPCIGYCPTQLDKEADNMLSLGPDDLTKDDIETGLKLTREEKARELHNAAIIAKLSEIYAQHVHNTASGYLDKPFKLQITRPKCEFDGALVPPTKFDSFNRPTFVAREGKSRGARLKKWYENGDVSGYGDVREQVTRVDEKVRNAREIPATQFHVEPELLERIAALWDQNFYPNHGIRVEPYKIHLYGPEGHFDIHRDTPQKDLVGTFLLGLGDTSTGGGLEVNKKKIPAHEGYWCAFYPDVPHRVKEVAGGYRAVAAFKIFCTPGSSTETETTARVRREVTKLMSKMRAPFGVMLERKYCLGTTELSGFDALLLKAALALPDVLVKHFPVALTAQSFYGSYNQDDPEEDYEMKCYTSVVPLTRGHLEKFFDDDDPYALSNTSHADCGCPWLEGVRDVPFFSLELSRTTYTCSEEQEEACNYCGNEAQAWREDSVYISYALLVLPRGRS